MLKIVYQTKFIKDINRIQKRKKAIRKLRTVIQLLQKENPLSPNYRNHKLQGPYGNYWECHIEPDWLLIYSKTKVELILIRTGTHSDLF